MYTTVALYRWQLMDWTVTSSGCAGCVATDAYLRRLLLVENAIHVAPGSEFLRASCTVHLADRGVMQDVQPHRTELQIPHQPTSSNCSDAPDISVRSSPSVPIGDAGGVAEDDGCRDRRHAVVLSESVVR